MALSLSFILIRFNPRCAPISSSQNYKFDHDLSAMRLTCPITCFDGDKDAPHDQDSFALLTSSKEFVKKVLPGGHFYLFDESNRDKILNTFCECLGDYDEIC